MQCKCCDLNHDWKPTGIWTQLCSQCFSKKCQMKNKAAVQLGKLGGKVKSEAKAKTARENGKKGGRPKKIN
jgi:hypothetical protein